MKISNFREIKIEGSNPLNWRVSATVDCETGFIFKKKENRKIHRKFAGFWYFSDTGEYATGFQIENLVRAYEAENGDIFK